MGDRFRQEGARRGRCGVATPARRCGAARDEARSPLGTGEARAVASVASVGSQGPRCAAADSRGTLWACARWGAVAAALSPGLARAEGAPPSAAPSLVLVSAALEYSLGPGAAPCPGEARLREEVARRLGYDPFAPGAGGRAMGTMRTVLLARADHGLTATTQYLDAAGTLRWTKAYGVKGASARDCEIVVSGVAIQMATELTVFEEAPKAAPAKVPPPAPPLTPPMTRAPTPAPPPECPHAPEPAASTASAYARRPWLEVGAGVSAVFGMSAVVVTSGTAHVGVRIYPFEDRGPWFSFAAEFRGDGTASMVLACGAVLAAEHAGRLGAGLRPLGSLPGATFTGSLFGCAIGTAGSVSGGFERSRLGLWSCRSISSTWALACARASKRGSQTSAALRLQADAMATIDPVRLALGPIQTGTSRFSLGLGAAGMILF